MCTRLGDQILWDLRDLSEMLTACRGGGGGGSSGSSGGDDVGVIVNGDDVFLLSGEVCDCVMLLF